MVCWTGRRQVAHGKAQSQTRENYDCGHAGRWFRSVKFKRLDSLLFHALGFWLGWRDRCRSKVGFRTTWWQRRFFGCVVEEAGIFDPTNCRCRLRASASGRPESQTRASASLADTSFPSFPNS